MSYLPNIIFSDKLLALIALTLKSVLFQKLQVTRSLFSKQKHTRNTSEKTKQEQTLK